MKNDKKYSLNGIPVTATELIKSARSMGYHEPDGFYFTSKAAEVLRQNGNDIKEIDPIDNDLLMDDYK